MRATDRQFHGDGGASDTAAALREYLDEIKFAPPLTADEKTELAERIANGDMTAKKRLIEANLRLVISIAGKYAGSEAQLFELIETGNLALVKAVEEYGHIDGGSFTSRAAWQIRQAVAAAVGKSADR